MRAARLDVRARSPRGAHRRAAVFAALAVVVVSGPGWTPASAQTLRGRAQVQFQRLETNRPGRPRLVTESWLQTYELNHSVLFRNRTSLTSQFTYTQLSYVDRPDAIRSPLGRLRLQNPAFGFSASHKPVRTTSLFGDSATAEEVTYRAEESRVDGYVSVPRGPLVSGSWVRVHRKEDFFTLGNTGISRNLRATQPLGPLSLRGGYSDRLRDPVPANVSRTVQRAWDGGAALNLGVGSRAFMGLDYSFFRTERPRPTRPADHTTSHQASIQTSFTQSPHSSWSGNYIFRRSGVSDGRNDHDTSHDGSLLYTHRPTRAVALTAGGGARSAREISGYVTRQYASATLSARGDIRPGWSTDAGVSHTTNWSADRATYGQQGAHLWTRVRARKGLDLNGNFQVTATGDTAARDNSVTMQASYMAVFEPWRTVRFSFSDNHYNSGSRLFENRSSSRSHTYDVRWTPLPRLEVRGVHSVTGTFPSAVQQFRTTAWTMGYDPSPRLKLWSSYSRSDRETAGVSDQIRGNEVVSVRVVSEIVPTFIVNLGLNVADPDKPTEARQYDVSVTKTFGR